MSDIENEEIVDNSTEEVSDELSLDDTLENALKASGYGTKDDESTEVKPTEVVTSAVDPKVAPETPNVSSEDIYTKYGIKKHIGHNGKEYPIDLNVAPSATKGDIKAIWAQLPEPVRAEFYRREGDFHEGLQKYTQAATYAVEVSKTFQPYQAMLNSQGYPSHQAFVDEALKIAYQLSIGSPEQKAQQLLALAQAYGVDMGTVTNVGERLNSGQPVEDPTVVQLRNELAQLKQGLHQQRTQQEQAQYSSYVNDVERFRSDPKNEYFDSVREIMGSLIESGQANDLEDAYNKAIYLHPETKAKAISKQIELKQREAADKAAGAKKASSVNVKTKGKPSSNSTKVGSLEDTLAAALAETGYNKN